MKKSIYLVLFIFLLLTPSLATAMLSSETAEIPYQINNSDRIVIGTVSEIHTYDTYTIYTITVKEWLYNPLPVDIIKVESKIGTNLRVEDEVEFTLHESVLLMLKDVNLNKQLFDVTFGFPGKHPVSDRDAVIKELKAQGKWQGENQTRNKTNNTGMVDTGTVGNQEGKSNSTQKSKSTPFISSFWVLAVVLGAVTYVRKMK